MIKPQLGIFLNSRLNIHGIVDSFGPPIFTPVKIFCQFSPPSQYFLNRVNIHLKAIIECHFYIRKTHDKILLNYNYKFKTDNNNHNHISVNVNVLHMNGTSMHYQLISFKSIHIIQSMIRFVVTNYFSYKVRLKFFIIILHLTLYDKLF